MSTTLHPHPPNTQHSQTRPESRSEFETPRFTSRRPSALDRLALRLGLLLITYGRRRYALSREEHARFAANDRARQARDLERTRTRGLLPPPR